MAAVEDEKHAAFGHAHDFPYPVVDHAGVVTAYKLVAAVGLERVRRRLASAVAAEVYNRQISLYGLLHGGDYGRCRRLFVLQRSQI